MSIKLEIELYHENGLFCAYVGDDIGGSGIKVSGDSASDVVNELMPYIYDYASQTDEE